ncbi:MAG: amidohydrolase [Deltaproteobacteria bacterium]|nr:amidohydrolase [Deltaproteobacteria bacterium]
MARHYQVISSDGHIESPPDVLLKYVPEALHCRAPRLVPLPGGGEGWIVEGRPLLPNGQNIVGGRPVKLSGGSYFNEDGSAAPGAGGPEQRLREQDLDGIDAEVMFPPVFASRFIEGIRDREVYLTLIRAYNSYLALDYCSVAPDRLIGATAIPVTGIDDAIAELEYGHSVGLNSACFHQFPNGSGLSAPEDDRFWARCLELGVHLAPHIGFGAATPPPREVSAGTGEAKFSEALYQRAGGQGPVFAMIQLMLEGVFDRFPQIQFFFAETNAHWLPGALFLLDDNYGLFKEWFGVKLAMKPSEYILKHCHFGIIRDPVAIRMHELIDMDRIMWSSDFPHSVGSYPNSRQFIADAFDGIDDAVRHKVLVENPAKFFGLDMDAAITETPAA